MVVKVKGEFVWHKHDHEDELFVVLSGTLIMEFRDNTVLTKAGEILIVPKGVEHCPRTNGEEVQVEDYVQSHTAKKHDLFLIPNGTIHSAGADNLVLEISATPYIFTFKMYDWVRLGLDGQPRPINIDHAFNNLNFDRKGEKVVNELISKPAVIDTGADWQLVHMPTHAGHFYDVHRIEFDSEVAIETNNVCHILMLVEGTSISIQTADGTTSDFHFAETIVIPAAALGYKIINTGKGRAKVVKAFVKDVVNLLSI